MKIVAMVLLVVTLITTPFSGIGSPNGFKCPQEPASRIKDSAWKMGQGITNIMFSPCKLFSVMTNSAIKGAYEGSYSDGLCGYLSGATAGYIAGSVIGLAAMLRQLNQGVIQMITFWRSGTPNKTVPPLRLPDTIFSPDDYLDADPFWFNGPIPFKNSGPPYPCNTLN